MGTQKSNQQRQLSLAILFAVGVVGVVALAPAQGQPPNAPGGGRGGAAAGASGRGGRGAGGGLGGGYNPRPVADPAQVERGKALYGVQCTFCHGVDARGGEGGPNLRRATSVLTDMKGEVIAPIVQHGRPENGMPKFDMSLAQIEDIASFLHSFSVGGRDPASVAPPSILVGDAKAGEAYFNSKCGACHSTTGDLKGIGGRIADPKTLQQTWLMPSAGRGGGFGAAGAATRVSPKTVTVTVSPTQKFEGRLDRIDDFTVTLVDASGNQRTFIREGAQPKVEVRDPQKPHKDLLAGYTDRDIHNVTAYLASVK